MNKVILDLCGGTGCWSKPYKDNNYIVYNITYPDFDVTKWQQIPEIRENMNGSIRGILAAPPCTMFSIARNDKTAQIPRSFRDGMKLVISCLEIIWEARYQTFRKNEEGLKFWALENPNGYLKDFLGQPYLKFHPYEYGDPYTKSTCLWGNFNIPKKHIVKPRDFEHPTTKGAKDFVSCVEHYADLKDIPNGYKEKTKFSNRKIMRSMTPRGFAQAFYGANK